MDNLQVTETKKKYRGTVGAFTNLDTGETHPAYFADFRTDGEHPTAFGTILRAKKDGTYKEEPFSVQMHRMEILPMPDRQVYDSNGFTNIYERYPGRQWQKGLCSGNTRITKIVRNIIEHTLPSSKFFSHTRHRDDVFGLSNMMTLLTGNHAESFTAAINEILNKGLMSRSFNKSNFLMLCPTVEPTFLLYRFEVPLAVYYLKDNRLKLFNKVYYQEVSDLSQRQHLNAKIEV